MAAYGVNEHNEACRKQNILNKQAYYNWMKKCQGNACDENPQLLIEKLKSRCSPEQQSNLCSEHLDKLCRNYETITTDQKNSKAMKHRLLTYSAKINGRFTSTNYCQQW